ncbi:MAG: NADPH-dependent F420 reductase [Thermoprotei archaeon]
MRIAVVGGTGDLGEGLIKRLCVSHQVVVGSRVKEKAQSIAKQLSVSVKSEAGVEPNLSGEANADAVKDAEIVILAVPSEYAIQTVLSLSGEFSPNCVLVSPVVPMVRTEDGFVYSPPDNHHSMAEAIAEQVSVPVVAAFHTLPAKKLADLRIQPEFDVPLVGDSESAVKKVSDLIGSIPRLRPLYVGGLKLAHLVEPLTPLILNVSTKNKLRNLSLKFV